MFPTQNFPKFLNFLLKKNLFYRWRCRTVSSSPASLFMCGRTLHESSPDDRSLRKVDDFFRSAAHISAPWTEFMQGYKYIFLWIIGTKKANSRGQPPDVRGRPTHPGTHSSDGESMCKNCWWRFQDGSMPSDERPWLGQRFISGSCHQRWRFVPPRLEGEKQTVGSEIRFTLLQ